ncbi:BTAD domain-containing putative transcriptional regulator [Actinosynnema sp. NPDC047251]|uniref:Transcriptional regulator, SARP family n=1 Tax=Saccharothrix espanaensis (strain ATCC 51144 / DSM 44229 / JCM 9112 / NBRC 15066 / NRRL 15764) TaxID=1179773 RepID=K0KCA9_SACES|nr:BTAD domain-containing putative transcriptional regulator [Saccharothrix espanaensis]CCH34243.1 Transcriptional regulator, SARP family [Saccharothrix espanaensis DSM 44229]
MVEIRLLGEVAVVVAGRLVDLGPARQRCVWAALAVDVNHVVPVRRLVERVWGEDAPDRVRATLLSYVSRLRQALADADGVALVRRSGGYLLAVDQSAVDLCRFRELWAHARAAEDAGAVALLSEALELWRGEPLTGVAGQWAEDERERLRRERPAAEHDLVDARQRTGRDDGLVPLLAARVVEHPLDERVAAQYLLALHRAGRSADALGHYRLFRARLVEELGTDPGGRLQQLHQRILDADSTLTVTTPTTPTTPTTQSTSTTPIDGVTAVVAVPRQLPAAPPHFTGRNPELATITSLVDGTSGGRTVVISAIAGTGGVGKTWLALTWANQWAERFPGGQLFVDLHGFSPTEQPLTPDAALYGFLTALGTSPERIPVELDTRAALYRSLVADRRMLIVLDNAATSDQVEPLLPGGQASTVLITSRRTLHRLVTRHGAHGLGLDVLTDTEAHALLAHRLGPRRLTDEPAAASDLLAFCQGFPLALGILTARAHTDPDLPLANLAAELRDHGIDALDDADPTTSLPAVLSWSLRGLTPDQRTVFALLGVAPGPDIGLPAAANLAGLPERETRAALRALVDASLIDLGPDGRYAMHNLVRAYATAHAHTLPEDVRLAALRRVVDFYLHTADAAGHLTAPHTASIRPAPPAPDVRPHPLPDQVSAMAWLNTEHPHLLAAQQTAAAHHRHDTVWHIAQTLSALHMRRGHVHDDLAVWQAALDAAAHLADPAKQIRAHRRTGVALTRLGRPEEAVDHLHRALALAGRHHDTDQQAGGHLALAGVWDRLGDARQALEHAGRGLDLFRALDEPVQVANALNSVGWYAARLGDHDTARDHCQAALALHRRHQDHLGEAHTLDSLGYLAHQAGDHREAVRHYEQAVTLRRTLGDSYEVANTLDSAGHPYAALGDHERARAVWREALELYRVQGRHTDAERVRRQLGG